MPVDRADHRSLTKLAGLQRLRLAAEERALAEARTDLHDAQGQSHSARAALLAREAELARLWESESFAPDRLVLQSALLSTAADSTREAEARMEEVAKLESERSENWKASHRQLQHLRTTARAAERRSARKAEDRSLAALPLRPHATEAQS